MTQRPTGRITFLGPNGAGKTTIKRLLGLLSGTGDISVLEKKILLSNANTLGPWLKPCILPPAMSALDNLEILHARPAHDHTKRLICTARAGWPSRSGPRSGGQLFDGHEAAPWHCTGTHWKAQTAHLDEPTGLDRGMHDVRQLILGLQKESSSVLRPPLAEAEFFATGSSLSTVGGLSLRFFERLSGQQNRFRVEHADPHALEKPSLRLKPLTFMRRQRHFASNSGDGTSLNHDSVHTTFSPVPSSQKATLRTAFLTLTEEPT